MRPKILEIEGLQSFRDKQVINFDALGETGLFGIFGPTGSGKSTVLDAITFALYGRVKRAERGTQGIININMDTARVAFSFELQKDGGRRTYRVERTYQRKKGSENSCEPKIARLIEVTEAGDIPVCDKASEIGSSIEELIGLSHDDFTRAVVLPQNSFQEFLLLDNSKKRDMLERIFYLEEYGKQLWDKLSRKLAVLKSRIDVLSGELAGYSDATDEALKESEKAMEAALKERLSVEKELKQLDAKYNEARELWQLTGELSYIVKKENEHAAGKTGMDKKRELLERAMKADGLLEMASSVKELAGRLKDTEKELKELLGIIPEVKNNLESSRSRYEEIRAEAAAMQPEMMERRTRLTDAFNLKAEITNLMQATSELKGKHSKLNKDIAQKSGIVDKATGELGILEKQILNLNNEIDVLKISPEYRQKIQEGIAIENEVSTAGEKVNELETKHGGFCTVIDGLEQKLSAVRTNIGSLSKKLDEYNNEIHRLEASTSDDRSVLLKEKDEISSWKAIYGALKLRKSDAENLKSKISVKQGSLKEMIDKAEGLHTTVAGAESKLEESRRSIEEKTGEIDRNIAYRLSKKLKDGEPCPVCGSEHHPGFEMHFDDVDLPGLEKELELLKLDFTSLEAGYKKAENAALVADEQVCALKTQIELELHELDIKNKEYETEKARLPEVLLLQDIEHMGSELVRMGDDADAKLKLLDIRDKSIEVCKANLQKVNDELADQQKLEYGLVTELKVTNENMEQTFKVLNDMKNSLETSCKIYADFLQQHGIASASAEGSRIAENDRKIEALQKQLSLASEKLAKDRSVLEKVKEELLELNKDNIKMESELSNQKKQLNEKENRLKELAGELDISEEIANINKKLEEYALSEGKLQEEIKGLDKHYNELMSRKTALEKQQEIYSNTFHSDNVRLEALMKEKGFSDAEDIAKSILPKDNQKTISDMINEYDRIGNNIHAQKDMLLKKLNSRSITEEGWSEIDTRYKYMCSYKEESVSKSEVAKSSYNSLKIKHDKWVELDGKYRELNNKSGLYSAIQKLLKAEHGKDNSFIDYIAEERLRYVAAKASETLGFMTKYKYALELDTNAGFIICDNSNGGVHRMITSLSGGETFLTSLSLALALSEQIQLKGQSPLEFFFLDEGFGTLDNNLLETVIDSLERLSSRDRVIGLISHVPELQNRIARRLIIEPPSMKGDGSRITIEKA